MSVVEQAGQFDLIKNACRKSASPTMPWIEVNPDEMAGRLAAYPHARTSPIWQISANSSSSSFIPK